MRARLGRVIAAAPAETWFFLSVSAFALVVMVVYWIWTYDWAGTILLFGFSVATGILGVRLLLSHPPRRTHEEAVVDDERRRRGAEWARAGERPGAEAAAAVGGRVPDGTEASRLSGRVATIRPPSEGEAGAEPILPPSAPDADRPFLDEAGRLPAPTIAPLAMALAAALVVTSVVLGPWLIIAAVLPLAWGAIGWVRDAGAEFRAVDAADAPSSDAPQGPARPRPERGEVPSATTPATSTGPAASADAPSSRP
ncbi:MAG TPA: hypothetical protein VEY67_11190 [Candidatus Dormibacteraeota bacterium]|nr:hypothetical protein [Candidatus Dormibacteraeota bacterium]